jgi:integrase
MSDHIRDVIRLALILGQRVGEITGMRADEIDLKNRIWVLAPDRVKNGIAHSVPLPDVAVSIIAPRMASNNKHLFPGRYGDGAPLLATAPNRALQRSLEKLGLEPFTVHDIRRSVNSQLARLGVSSEIRSRLLNHVSGRRASVTENVYNVHQYDEEKRFALGNWAAELERILSGSETSNVVALRS